MTTRAVIGAVALAGVATCGVITTLLNQQLVQMVNEKLPGGERFSPIGWYLLKTRRLHREYRIHFPNGNLILQERIFGVLMFVCLVVCARAVGFFSL